ncbi:MAG TPA: transposase, partial [bacterium]|nr:transposase [bacterium]
MIYHPEKHHRRSIRLQGYDYTQPGAYFITLCAYNHECLFGDVIDGNVLLNALGRCVESTWFDLPRHNPHVSLDAFIVMPNHGHGIVVLNDGIIVGAGSVVGAG